MSYADNTMPTTYDSNVAGSSQTGGKVDTGFVRSLKGIFRIVEIILALIGFICAAVGRRGHRPPAAWCMFVTMFSFLTFLVLFFLWLFRVLSNVGNKFPIRFTEFVMYVVFSGFYFIAAIVAAVNGKFHPGLAAAAFFLFVMVALCATDAFFHYREWFSSDEGPFICGKGGSGGNSSAPPPSTGPPAQEPRGPTY